MPLIDGQAIEFLGEINDKQKTSFLRDAAALLFPIDWPEPFGLVMIEAMACGTPVLAFRCGSVSEIVEDGVTGKVVESEDEAIAALPELLSYDRRAVRKRFQERFTAARMARDYADLYRTLMTIPVTYPKGYSFVHAQSNTMSNGDMIPTTQVRSQALAAQSPKQPLAICDIDLTR